MNITVNKSIVKEIYSDNLLIEIEDYLNSVIDDELEKDDINTDLIDECINALESLTNKDITPALKIVLTEKDIVKYCKKHTSQKSNIYKRAIAACLIIAICSSAAALNTNVALADQVREIFAQIISALNITADESEHNSQNQTSSVYAVFPKNYSFKIKSKKDIDLNSIKVYAVYQDGSEHAVSLNDCTVRTVESIDDNSDEILVVIAYDGCAFSVTYTIEE